MKNILSLLDALATEAPTGSARRRTLLRQLGRAAVAALPLSLAGPAPAAAQPLVSVDNITLLLRLERTLQAFYTQALNAGFLSGTLTPDVQRLQLLHQTNAGFFAQAFSNSGINVPLVPPVYDFSGVRLGQGVLFPNALRTETGFLELAQQLEDAAVRIYLGQTTLLTADRTLLGAVQRLTSTAARQAAHVRQLRRRQGVGVKTWPSNSDPAPASPLRYFATSTSTTSSAPTLTTLYAGEANEQQFLAGFAQIPFNSLLQGDFVVQSVAISESFDEPLSLADANNLLSLFADA